MMDTQHTIQDISDEYAESSKEEANLNNPIELAHWLCGQYRFAVDRRTEHGNLYWYDSELGVYCLSEPYDEIERRIVHALPTAQRRPASLIYEAKYIVKTLSPDIWHAPPLDRVNCADGIYHFDTHRTHDHSPDFLSPIQLNWRSKHDGDDRIYEFLTETLSPAHAQRFIDTVALCLTPLIAHQVSVFFEGIGRNGKGTAISIIHYLLNWGHDSGRHQSARAFSLRQLTSRFATSQLSQSLVNIAWDTRPADMRDTSVFKTLVSGEPGEGEAKQKDYRSIRPYARLLCLVNDMSGITDHTLGLGYRIETISFERVFEEPDVTLKARLLTPEGIDGFMLRHVLPAYHAVSSRGLTPLVDEHGNRIRTVSALDEGLEACLAFTDSLGDELRFKDVWAALTSFWADTTETKPSKQVVSRRLQSLGAVRERRRDGIHYRKVLLK